MERNERIGHALYEIGAAILRRYDHHSGWHPVYDDEGELKFQQLWVNELDPHEFGLERAKTNARAVWTWMHWSGVPLNQVIIHEPYENADSPYRPLVSVRARIWPEMTLLLHTLRG